MKKNNLQLLWLIPIIILLMAYKNNKSDIVSDPLNDKLLINHVGVYAGWLGS